MSLPPPPQIPWPRRWIVIRGLARNSEHWGDFRRELQEALPQCEFEYLDTAGNGTEIHRKSFFSVESNVEDLRRRSTLLSQKEPLGLFAVSLGGMIAADWSLRYPEEIQGLVMINSSSKTYSPFFERLLPTSYPMIFHLLTNSVSDYERELQILRMVSNLDDNERALFAEKFAKIPICTRANLLRQLFAASRFELPQKPPKAKLCFFASQKDRLVSSQCTAKIAAGWESPVLFHPWAGHDLALDDPKWLAEKMKGVYEHN